MTDCNISLECDCLPSPAATATALAPDLSKAIGTVSQIIGDLQMARTEQVCLKAQADEVKDQLPDI